MPLKCYFDFDIYANVFFIMNDVDKAKKTLNVTGIQVCVEQLVVIHRYSACHCSHLLLNVVLLGARCCRSISLAGPTAANPPHAAAAGEWDRQTDRHHVVT